MKMKSNSRVIRGQAFSRRRFLWTTATLGAGLVFGVRADGEVQRITNFKEGPFAIWIGIDPAGTVTISCHKAELGQGMMTSLAALVAEELDVDWSSVCATQAPVRPDMHDHLTVGSLSISQCWGPLRLVGATARDLLVRAAALRWGIPPARCWTTKGRVLGPAGAQLSYADLIGVAAAFAVNSKSTPHLKDPARFDLIGRSLRRLDVADKVNGVALYGIDTRLPGMVYSVIQRCPYFGGMLEHVDTAQALQVAGVRRVLVIPAIGKDAYTSGGVAVVASSTWAAIKGREALNIRWERPRGSPPESNHLGRDLLAAARSGGSIVRSEGDAQRVIESAPRALEAIYEVPFLAHATMEPMNATVHVKDGAVDAWLPTQNPADARLAIAHALGRKTDTVNVHMTLVGGGFGRRDATDFAIEAAQVADATRTPTQVIWTREDDIRHDRFRPAAVHRLRAALDRRGMPIAWYDQMASTSISAFLEGPIARRPEASEIGGAVDVPYAIPAIRVEYCPVPTPVPVGWWRSVENSINAFSTESFVNEIAAAAGVDALEMRRRLLRVPSTVKDVDGRLLNTKRLLHVAELAAKRSNWGTATSPGHARGIACNFCRGSYVAVVAECSIVNDTVKVHRLDAAIDCGRAINPRGVEVQMEGGIVWGLSAALDQEITISDGRIDQSNFHDFPVLFISQCPSIHVEVVVSDAAPTGAGELGVPAVAPAIGGAILRLSGRPVRRLPIRVERQS